MKTAIRAAIVAVFAVAMAGCSAPSSFDGYVHAECSTTDPNQVTTCSVTQKPIPTVTQTVTASPAPTTTSPAPTPTPTTTTPPATTVTKVNDTSFTYAGGTWLVDTPAAAYLANNHWILGTTSTSWSYGFTGTQVAWYGEKSPDLGIVAVSIDGGAATNVDPYASSRTEQNLLFTSAVLASGSHTIKVTGTGTKNAASSGTYMSADRVDVSTDGSLPTTPPSPTPTPSPTTTTPAPTPTAGAVPAYNKIVVVVDENTQYGNVIGSSNAPYINSLRAGGANLTQMFAETHPSEPNYLALYAGNTYGIADDNCRTGLTGPSLGTELQAAGKTFIGYGENLDADGSTTCVTPDSLYKDKHNPWAEMASPNPSFGHKFSEFPTDFTTLPDVSIVVPNMCNDIHDCSVATGDTWIKNNLGAYASWAQANNSLLVITFDEDDTTAGNHIPTILYGAHVVVGDNTTAVNHYNLLGTIEDAKGVARIGSAVGKPAIGAFQ